MAQAEPQRDFQIDDEEDQQIREVEEALAEVLVLDESGQVVMRAEMQEVLPEGVPIERINMMLGTFIEVDDDGKFRLTESARPYLPMLKNFLRPEIMARLRKLRSMTPEERKAELQKLMEEQQQEGGGFGMRPPEGRGPAPRREPEAQPAPRVSPRATPTPRAEEGDRLDRIERRLARIEELLERSLEGGAAPRERGSRGLGRLFGNRGGSGGGLGLGKGLRRARTLADGMRRLSEIATPEDMDLLRRMMADSGLKLDDLRNRDELLNKLQQSMEPQDLGRMMELFSEFMGTDEGRRFVDELDGMAKDFEGMMNGDRGARMGELMQRLEGMLGKGGGNNKMLDTLRKLTQGRDRDREPSARSEEHHRSTPKRLHKDGERPSSPTPRRSSGSRLY
ncbi:MAG: hypothetical protein KDD82_30775 [Planctomycetes bacterium]|nr:hypothetical protein [Planctomycetota bacterium]